MGTTEQAVILAARALAADPTDRATLFELRVLLAALDKEIFPEPEYVADPPGVIVPEYEEET